MQSLIKTDTFNFTYRFVTETDKTIFLTGKAGTGKTTFLKYLKQTSVKKLVVAAPTGVAAINAGGVTLHSLFHLPFTPFIPLTQSKSGNSHPILSQIKYNRERLNLLRSMELLVIDEASMVASHTIDAIDTILKYVKRNYTKPFGGTQLLFIGDLYQLPPVVKNQEWDLLKNYYPSVFFFDSIVLRENIPVMIELKDIFRQQDSIFIDILNGVRNNNLSLKNFDLLNERLKKNFDPDEKEGYIVLTTHNSQSDELNEKKLQKLSGLPKVYTAKIQDQFPDHLYPAELDLKLKIGAQVMFLKNDVEEKKYFNGKIGVITSLNNDEIKVKCENEKEEINVKKFEWKNTSFSLNPNTQEIIEEVLGSFTQYPLRLAWGITIHKSQGLTFAKVIVDAEKAFANGQVYVALSRCTSLEGLVLTSPINKNFLGANENLLSWQNKTYDEKTLPNRFQEARKTFIQLELINLFTWKNWSYELAGLNHTIRELQNTLPPECITWIHGLLEKQKELTAIADKFKSQLTQLSQLNESIEENLQLQKRVSDAGNYFINEITNWTQQFKNHPVTTDLKKNARKLDVSLNDINATIHEISHKLTLCKKGFILNNYLENRKIKEGTLSFIQSSYEQHQSTANSISNETHNHPALYRKLTDMRNRIGKTTNLPLYTIFSNDAIKNTCLMLPQTKEALLNVKGFGKAKVSKYGAEVVQLVCDYCSENNIESQINISTPPPERPKKSNTVLETIKLFKENKSIEKTAKKREFAISTIEGHLATGIREGLIEIEELIPLEEVTKIANYFPKDITSIQLSPIKESYPEDISYGKLRMVGEWLKSKEDTI